MQIGFYLAGLVAILATLGVIGQRNPVRALLSLVVSLLAVAMCFLSLGAPFAAMLEIIVYAGAIMVLFVFVVMRLNLGKEGAAQESQWLAPGVWTTPSFLSLALFAILAYSLFHAPSGGLIGQHSVSDKAVGVTLFSTYLLLVELASMLLLAALVAAFHLGRREAHL